MKKRCFLRFQYLLVLLALAGFLIPTIDPPPLLACRGNMAWRFMPIEQARKEVARIEAELKKQSAAFFPLQGSIEFEKWIKFYDNPVFKTGADDSWEGKSVDCFSIGVYGGRYMMWYVGTPNVSLNCQIGLATSPDGIHWTKHPENPVIRLGEKGSWDESILICQSVVFDKDENLFKMWYIGGSPKGVLSIGLATSLDGARWTKYADNPVLLVTQPWEGTVLEAFTVLKINGSYKIWFGGNTLNQDKASIGYATSPDGFHWTKHSGNPIFSPSAPKRWDSYSISDPDVIYHKGTYHMWYKGWKRRGGNAWIGHATSLDGVTWERDAQNPVLITSALPGSWENYEVYRPRIMLGKESPIGPSVVIDRMWYSGRTYNLSAQIGLAYQFAFAPSARNPRSRLPHVTQDRMELAVDPAPQGNYSITYFLPWLGNVQVGVRSSSGTQVKTLVRETQLAGFYQTAWDGRDDSGLNLPAGLYYLEVRSGENALLTREIVLKK